VPAEPANDVRRRLRGRLLPALAVLAVLAMASAAGARAQALAADGLTRDLAPLPVTIRYEKRYGRVADKVTDICHDEIPRIAAELGLAEMAPIEIVVTANARGYDRSLEAGLPRWGVAFAVLEEQRILVDVNKATRAYNSLEEVVPHELSHLLLYQRVPRVRFPIWFLEGLAQWQAREWSMVDGWQLATSVWNGSAPPLRDMTYSYPAEESRAQGAYRVSYAAFTELFSAGGFERLPAFLTEVDRRRSFETAFLDFWGFSLADYGSYFQDDLERRYHSKLFLLQEGPLFGFAALLFLAVIARYLIRSRRKFRQLEE
jgi:hypothetical protein